MRLLVVASVWPHATKSFEAANVITHAILSELAAMGLYELSFLYINTSLAEVPHEAKQEIDKLKQAGISFLEPLLYEPDLPLSKRPKDLLTALFLEPASILFGYNAGKLLPKKIGCYDGVLTVWSEVGINAFSRYPAMRFAYHGNPDHKVFNAQYEIMRLAGVQPKGFAAIVDWMRRITLSYLLERAHLSVLRHYDFIADVAANDAKYYVEHKIRAFYLQNMWPSPPIETWEMRRDILEKQNPYKIIGNVGNMSATGNSLGFVALGQEVLPALKKQLVNVPFEVHIFGGKEPKSFLKPLLMDSHIKLRGFVDDLETEILSAPVFLISNNHHRFKVGHTRVLHAWSLGACVIAFADCRDAMPEIEHGRNALLGNNAEEVAILVAQALSDRKLRRHIAYGGIETLKAYYTPSKVTHALSDRIQTAMKETDD